VVSAGTRNACFFWQNTSHKAIAPPENLQWSFDLARQTETQAQTLKK
jgi:hypothetical protein